MYLETFGLTEHPFRLSPDPRFLCLSRQHSRAYMCMKSTVWFSDGFVVVTGEIGAGKTILLERFLSELDDTHVVARLHQTQIDAVEFLQILLAKFGQQPFDMGKAQLLETLSDHLRSLLAEGRRVVIVIDEAQNLSTQVLEEIRMLSDISTGGDRVVSIILAGQPELNATLDAPGLAQLAQRTRLRFHLDALDESETADYVNHRLTVAGAPEGVFTAEALSRVYRFSEGVPRLINQLCSSAMLVAYAEDRTTVDADAIEEAARELHWTDGATSPKASTVGPPEERTVGWLVIHAEGEQPREFPLTEGRLVLGRTPDNDIQLNTNYVSRHHAQLTVRSRTALIEDLNSTNGVVVDGRRRRRYTLSDGDRFLIGKHELIYRAAAHARPRPAAMPEDEEVTGSVRRLASGDVARGDVARGDKGERD